MNFDKTRGTGLRGTQHDPTPASPRYSHPESSYGVQKGRLGGDSSCFVARARWCRGVLELRRQQRGVAVAFTETIVIIIAFAFIA